MRALQFYFTTGLKALQGFSNPGVDRNHHYTARPHVGSRAAVHIELDLPFCRSVLVSGFVDLSNHHPSTSELGTFSLLRPLGS